MFVGLWEPRRKHLGFTLFAHTRRIAPFAAPRALLTMPRHHVLSCTPSGGNSSGSQTICVQASPNPEYASQPGNYAHWLLAHLFPLLSGALNISNRTFVGEQWHIMHGGNTVLPVWAPRYAELFGVTCVRSTDDSSGGQLLGYGCDLRLNVSVAAFAFCRRAFWASDALRQVSAYLRSRLRLPALSEASMTGTAFSKTSRIVILERRGTDGRRGFVGLERACEPGFDKSAIERGVLTQGMAVECTSFNMSTPLAAMAQAVGSPDVRALISGHGAGLANVIYMQAGAAMAEFDAIKNMGKARNFYQYLAEGLGVRSIKVWLNASGARFCPPRVNACGSGNLNMYRASIKISATVLDDVLTEVAAIGPLRDCGVARDEEGAKMYRAKPRQPGWGALEMLPWTKDPLPWNRSYLLPPVF